LSKLSKQYLTVRCDDLVAFLLRYFASHNHVTLSTYVYSFRNTSFNESSLKNSSVEIVFLFLCETKKIILSVPVP